MFKLIRIIVLLVILAGVAFGVLLFNLNTIIKSGVETAGPMVVKVPVLLAKSNISLLSGQGELTGLVVQNPAGFQSEYAFQLNKVFVDIDALSVLRGNEIHIREIIIDGPHIIYDGGLGNSNIKTIMDNLKSTDEVGGKEPSQEPSPAPKSSKDQKVVIDHLVIKNIKLGVSNKLLQGKTINVELPPIEQRDIGKDGDKSMEDIIKDVLGSLNSSIIPAVKKSFGNVEDSIQNIGSALKEGVDENGKDEIQKATDKAKNAINKWLK
jgi:hypothetical protein